jgi:hypothetical protein
MRMKQQHKAMSMAMSMSRVDVATAWHSELKEEVSLSPL